MIFDAGATKDSLEYQRGRHCSVTLNGVDVTDRCMRVDTEMGEIRWLLLNSKGHPFIRNDETTLAEETVKVDPKQLRVVPREDCPPELRW